MAVRWIAGRRDTPKRIMQKETKTLRVAVNRYKAAGKPEKAPLGLGGRFLHGWKKCVASAFMASPSAVR